MGRCSAPLLPIATVLAALLACGPSNDSLKEKLESRAAFDLNCGALRYTPLEETNGYITSYGVEGCGRRVTYVLNASTQSWVMNTESTGTLQDAPPPSPPPPRR
jgi:hypothetical protein